MTGLDFLIVAIYLLLLVAVATIASKKIKTSFDYLIAGRQLTFPILIASLVSTYYGLDVIFGSPETSYLQGISTFYLYSAPFYLSYALLAIFFVSRVRNSKAISLPQYLESRCGKGIRLPVSIITAFYSLPVISVFGLGLLGSHFFDLSPFSAILLGTLFAAVYTAIGGLWADVISDAMQFLIMCVSVAIAGFVAINQFGMPSSFTPPLDPQYLSFTGGLSIRDIIVYGAVALIPFVDPGLYQRIFAAASDRSIKVALWGGIIFWAAFDWIVVYLGMVGINLVASQQIPADIDPARIALEVASQLLPVGLLGLFVAGAIGSAMSTIDSYALISSSTIVRDIRGDYSADENRSLFKIRIGVIIAALFAILISTRFERLRDAWIVMASLLVSGMLVPMVVSLFNNKQLRATATSAAWAGGLVAFGLFFAFEFLGAYDADYATRRISINGVGSFIREEIIFFALPSSILAAGIAFFKNKHHTKDPAQ